MVQDFLNFFIVNRQKKQGWLFEELMMLKRKLDDANYEISKTKTDIYSKTNYMVNMENFVTKILSVHRYST